MSNQAFSLPVYGHMREVEILVDLDVCSGGVGDCDLFGADEAAFLCTGHFDSGST